MPMLEVSASELRAALRAIRAVCRAAEQHAPAHEQPYLDHLDAFMAAADRALLADGRGPGV